MPDEPKSALRKRLKTLIAAVPPEHWSKASKHVRDQLAAELRVLGQGIGRPLKVAVFAAGRDEIDLVPLVTQFPEVEWYFPRCDGPRSMVFHLVRDPLHDLTPGYCNLPEPSADLPAADPHDLDMVITPGYGFDADGGRLGKGGGFYDNYLMQTGNCARIGVCLPCQLCENIPMEGHDQRVHRLIIGDHKAV